MEVQAIWLPIAFTDHWQIPLLARWRSVASAMVYPVLASEAYLTSSMIAQETNYLLDLDSYYEFLLGHMEGRWFILPLKWTYALDLIFPSLTFETFKCYHHFGFADQTSVLLYPSEHWFRSKNLFLAKKILWHNVEHIVFSHFVHKPQKLLAWKNHKNSLSVIKVGANFKQHFAHLV